MSKFEIFAAIVGRARRPRWLLEHLAHEAGELEIIYPLWVLREGEAVTLIDTGFDAERAAARGVADHHDPDALLAAVAIAPTDVRRVIVSHLHWDHFSSPQRYANAEYLIQRADVEYFGGYGREHPAAAVADARSVAEIEQLRAAGRIVLLDGDATITPSVRTHLVGGHTPGLQVTVVERDRRPIVFACDAAHRYWNVEHRTPTALINDYTAYIRGLETVERLAGSAGRWFPGHDPRLVDALRPVAPNVLELPAG